MPVSQAGDASAIASDSPSLAADATAADLAEAAVTGREQIRADAAQRLRVLGRDGLKALEERWAQDAGTLRRFGSLDRVEAVRVSLDTVGRETLEGFIDPLPGGPAASDPIGHRARLEEAFRVVTAQYDGLYTGLFWHTDRESAVREAAATGKPVLSLRVLGQLDNELC